ncbi:MAG TPA: M48 family metalloprotease [Gemmatimonadales bacterium]|nr:M48 family metalloprotease [Gemmatimonadales bacterium]
MHVRTAFAAAALATVACATNPVTGKSELSLISESQEIEMGKEAAQQVQQSIGFYDDPALQSYVSQIGLKMAHASERPQLPWEFHVVNDASVNAFALPGGFIYVTRGLMGAISNEAELATVVGHEIGHVTNRHTVQQISKQQLFSLGLGIGMILKPGLQQFAGLLNSGLQLLFLKYSRDDESQADKAGFRYALHGGWDVRQMLNMFQVLEGESQLDSTAGKLPEWASTHPAPEDRIQATEQRLDTLHADLSNLTVNREGYLEHIKGIVYGEDPRQGYFQGNAFLHPDLRFQLTFPNGWQRQNTPAAVVAVSPNQDAMIQLQLAGKVSPEQAAQQFLSQQGIQPGRNASETVNGLPVTSSYFTAQTQEGQIEGLVSFLSYNNTTYGILGYTGAGNLSQYDQTFRQTIGSFRPLTDPAAINVQPARVELVRVNDAMTLKEFDQRYPSSIPLAELAVINGLDGPNGEIRPGRYYKRVVGGIPHTAGPGPR